MAASLSKTLRLHRRHLFVPSASSRFSTTGTSAPSPPPLPPPPPPSAAAAAARTPPPGKETSTWSKILLFVPGAITFGLGTWQLFRRQEKIEMLEYRKKKLEMEPLMCNQIPSSVGSDLAALEFRKLICEGDFDEDKSVYIGPRARSISGVTENGYYIITPLIPRTTEPGSLQSPVLVNRGWVPRGWRDKKMRDQQGRDRALESKEGEEKTIEKSSWWKFWSKQPKSSEIEPPKRPPVRVIGVIRGSEKPSIFVPANEPSNGQWFYVDVPMIARACGLPENTIYIEDISEDTSAINPYPLPKDVNTLIHHSVMPQDHLNYTITWYSLSAAVTYMAAKRIKVKKVRL